jgi:radical SAM protein with 4Fe4S-binding SPASM domain
MIGTRLDEQNRTQLEKVLPLDTPFIIYIDPSSVCNLRCNFCYQSNHEDYIKIPGSQFVMPMSLYEIIIDDLYNFPVPVKVIRLYGFGEPLVNVKFPEMVKYVKERFPNTKVDTTTNGILLHERLNKKIIESGIDRINISINGLSNEGYKKFCGKDVDFISLVKNITDLYKRKEQCYIFIKINEACFQDEFDKEKFIEIFEPIADSINIEYPMKCWDNVDNLQMDSIKGIYGQEVDQEIEVCPYPMYEMCVHSDGTVSACFLDYNKKLIIGDATVSPISEIWNGKKLKAFQSMMLKKCRSLHPVCKNCQQLKFGACDNIDEYADEILRRF